VEKGRVVEKKENREVRKEGEGARKEREREGEREKEENWRKGKFASRSSDF